MIDCRIDTNNIATLTWNAPDAKHNVVDIASCVALGAAIEEAANVRYVKGLLLTSAKADFVTGGNLDWLVRAKGTQILAFAKDFQRVLRRLETCGKPVAVAMPGSALGPGFEIALAAHHRVAADNPKARFGFTDVTLGLAPGGGGTQRLPRLLGVERALPLLLEGKRLDVAAAREAGLLDAVAPAGEEVAAARQWLLSAAARAQQPWDVPGFKVPGGDLRSPRVQQTFMAANALLRERTFGNYPAPVDMLSSVYEGLATDFDTGLATETRYFVRTAQTPAARNMIRLLHFNLSEANRLVARPRDVPVQRYTRVGILGAGMMGAGIAYVTANAGIDVLLLDVAQETAERGKAYSQGLLEKQAARGQLSAAQAEVLLARIVPTTDYARLAGAGLVIEAVFEDRAIKADVTRRAEAQLAADALFASNTSTLPITGLAAASVRPANFIGLHFFSPVEKMPLVEVIVGKATSQQTLARALDYVKAIGMTPIVVNDGRGFYTSRVFATYVLEGLAMLAEGAAPALVENAGVMAGMPVGPLAVTDEVSAELIVKIDHQTRSDLGAAYRPHTGHAVAAKLVELGRLGRKVGRGFYEYPAEGRKQLWPGLSELFPASAQQPPVDELIQRLVVVQSVETARCLEEGVLTTARDADVGSLLGWGFPAFRGGTIGHIDTIGVATFVAQCARLAEQYGERFAPPQLLRDMAANGGTFYPV